MAPTSTTTARPSASRAPRPLPCGLTSPGTSDRSKKHAELPPHTSSISPRQHVEQVGGLAQRGALLRACVRACVCVCIRAADVCTTFDWCVLCSPGEKGAVWLVCGVALEGLLGVKLSLLSLLCVQEYHYGHLEAIEVIRQPQSSRSGGSVMRAQKRLKWCRRGTGCVKGRQPGIEMQEREEQGALQEAEHEPASAIDGGQKVAK